MYDDFFDPSDDYAREPRAFCYDLAIQLLNQAKDTSRENWYEGTDTIKGILLLLYCWNFAARETKKANFENVGELLRNNRNRLQLLEKHTIRTVNGTTWDSIEQVFDEFRQLLGQTGASKALSLLNPELFVMWDTAIRKHLQGNLFPEIRNGDSGKCYVAFLKGIQEIIEKFKIPEKLPPSSIVAKKIDEFHYVTIVMNKKSKGIHDEDCVAPKTQVYMPDNLRGRSIHEKVIPMVCNLRNMLEKLKKVDGNVSLLEPWEKRSYKAYQIHKIHEPILNSHEGDWKEIIRGHILSEEPSSFGASCIDIYLVAYVAQTYGAGRKAFLDFARENNITQKDNTAQAIWQVGKGDGEFLDILCPDGTVKDVEFIERWISG